MRALLRAAPLALTLALALGACTGSGSSGAPVAPIAGAATPTPLPTATPVNTATFGLSVTIPNRSGLSASRSPQYVSQGTAALAAYDGNTIIYVGNVVPGSPPTLTTVYAKVGTTTVTGGSCVTGASSSTCTITIVTTIGAHSFDVVTYPVAQGQQAQGHGRAPTDVGTIPTFTGVILAEGELAVTLVAGTNPAQTINPLGVADRVNFTGPVLTQHLNGNGPLVGIIGTTYTFQYVVTDSSNLQTGGFQIVTPGDYDNGPVTITETDDGGIVTMTPISQGTPPAATGTQSFNVTCAANGTATITASAKTKPNATYASALTYTSSNYPTATIGTTTLQCVPNSATLPVTVQ
jgi:hypothetical protein